MQYQRLANGELYEAWQVNAYDRQHAPAWVWDYYEWADSHGVDLARKGKFNIVPNGCWVVRLVAGLDPFDVSEERFRSEFK